MPEVEPLAGLGSAVSIGEDDHGNVLITIYIDGRTVVWAPYDAEDNCTDATEVSQALGTTFGRADHWVQIREALDDAECPSAADITSVLGEMLDLPQLEERIPLREVTLQRGDPAAARLAARVAARRLGPTALASLDDRWTALRSTGDHDTQNGLTAMVAAGSTKRRSVVLALWRGEGSAAGIELIHKSDVIAQARWNTGWWGPTVEDLESRDAEAQTLARRIGGADADMVALRSLMRARTWDPDPLADLVAILDLPEAALAVLDERPGAAPWVAAEPASHLQMVWDYVKEFATEPLFESRRVQVVIAVLAFLAALAALAVVTVGYGALLTNGALIDQDGVTGRQVVGTIIGTLAVALNSWSGVQLIRRGSLF